MCVVQWFTFACLSRNDARSFNVRVDGCVLDAMTQAARNVLLDGKFHALVANFGLGREKATAKDENDSKGVHVSVESGRLFDARWTALEAVTELKFSEASDVWSFGITMAEIFQDGREPYQGMPTSQVVRFLERGGRIPKEDLKCSDGAYQMLVRCWEADPKLRLSFTQLAQHLSELVDTLPDLVHRPQASVVSLSWPFASIKGHPEQHRNTGNSPRNSTDTDTDTDRTPSVLPDPRIISRKQLVEDNDYGRVQRSADRDGGPKHHTHTHTHTHDAC